MRSTRRLALASATGAILMTTVGAAAFACTNLATLMLSSQTGSAGDTVTVTGGSFLSPADPAAGTPVAIRWGGSDGPVVAVASPDQEGIVSASFVVSDAKPGSYVVTASQAGTGPTSGLVARAQYTVVGPPAAGVVPSSTPSPVARYRGPDRSWGLGVAISGLGLLGAALFTGGLFGVVRHANGHPVTVKVVA